MGENEREKRSGAMCGANERKLLRSRILTIQLGKCTLQLERNHDNVSWYPDLILIVPHSGHPSDTRCRAPTALCILVRRTDGTVRRK